MQQFYKVGIQKETGELYQVSVWRTGKTNTAVVEFEMSDFDDVIFQIGEAIKKDIERTL